MCAQSHFAGLPTRCLTSQIPIVQEQRLLGKQERGASHQNHSGAWENRVKRKVNNVSLTTLQGVHMFDDAFIISLSEWDMGGFNM